MFMNKQSVHKCSIIQYPNGKFGFVGSIPENLGYWKRNSIQQDIFVSKVYNTRGEAERDLI